MVLVEIYADETLGNLRAAVDDLLTSVPVPPRSGWWHPYEFRGTYQWNEVRFFEMYCVAGSVSLWLWQLARDGGQRRVILLPSPTLLVYGDTKMVGRGDEVPVSPAAVRPVPSRPKE